jgi:hypothetical protein
MCPILDVELDSGECDESVRVCWDVPVVLCPSAGSTESGEGPFGDLPTRQDGGILNSRRDDRRFPTQRAAIVVFGQNFRIRSIPPFPRALRNDRYLRIPSLAGPHRECLLQVAGSQHML